MTCEPDEQKIQCCFDYEMKGQMQAEQSRGDEI